eukprot:4161506-Prorocentrum_lima.AAC.1
MTAAMGRLEDKNKVLEERMDKMQEDKVGKKELDVVEIRVAKLEAGAASSSGKTGPVGEEAVEPTVFVGGFAGDTHRRAVVERLEGILGELKIDGRVFCPLLRTHWGL